MPKVLSLDKSLTVLEAIFSHRDGIGTRALATQLKLNVATVHNIAQTYCKRGYLRQDPDSKAFHPGLRLLHLGRHPSYIHSLSLSIASIVDDVASKLGESVLLASLDHGRILSLKYVESRQALRVQESGDLNNYAYCNAVGKILLAFMTELELEGYLREVRFQRFTARTIAGADALKQELARVREHGYARTRDEFYEGVSAIAVPIRDPWESIVAAIGVSAPTARMEQQNYFEVVLGTLREAADILEKQWKDSGQNRPPKRLSRKNSLSPEMTGSSATEMASGATPLPAL